MRSLLITLVVLFVGWIAVSVLAGRDVVRDYVFMMGVVFLLALLLSLLSASAVLYLRRRQRRARMRGMRTR